MYRRCSLRSCVSNDRLISICDDTVFPLTVISPSHISSTDDRNTCGSLALLYYLKNAESVHELYIMELSACMIFIWLELERRDDAGD